MQDFKVTKERRVFLADVEIKRVLGFSVVVDAGNDPEVVLRVAVDSVDIEGYKAAPDGKKGNEQDEVL